MSKANLMDCRNRLQEAIGHMNEALDTLASAQNWGTADVILGGFFTSWIKRSRMESAQSSLYQAKEILEDLSKDFVTLKLSLPEFLQEGGILTSKAIDLFFDNIFTDFMVQKRINDFAAETYAIREQLLTLDQRLAELE